MDKIRLAFSSIAAAIRGKTGTTTKMTPAEMPAAINSIITGEKIKVSTLTYINSHSKWDDADYDIDGDAMKCFDKYYELTSDSYNLDYGFFNDKTLKILDLTEFCNATSMSQLCNGATNLTELTLPESFPNCTNFSMTFQGTNKVLAISDLNAPKGSNFTYTFRNANLTKTIGAINSPKNTNMGNFCYGCTALESIGDIYAPLCTSTANAFYNTSKLQSVNFTALKTLSPTTFYGCTALQEVVIGSPGNPVSTISTTAFAGGVPSACTVKIYTATGADPTGGSKLGLPATCTVQWLAA